MKPFAVAVGFAFVVGTAVGWLAGGYHRKNEQQSNPVDFTESIQIVSFNDKGQTYTPFLIRMADEAKPVYRVEPPAGAKKATIKFHNNAVVIHATVE